MLKKTSAQNRSKRIRNKLTVARLLPNLVTLAALSSGLTSVRFALQEKWELAVLAIIVAGILDALDGRVARMLGQSSHFGGELDSLSDAISFGVAPALIMYLRTLQNLGHLGWIVCVLYVVCMALRLARFNTLSFMDNDGVKESWSPKFFVGVPAPSGAVLLLLPLYVSLSVNPTFRFFPPELVCLYTMFISLLLVSKIPTFSTKGHQIHPSHALPLLLLGGIFVASLISITWITLSTACLAYLCSIPLSWRLHKRLKN